MGPASFAQAPAGAKRRTISAVRRRRARKGTPQRRRADAGRESLRRGERKPCRNADQPLGKLRAGNKAGGGEAAARSPAAKKPGQRHGQPSYRSGQDPAERPDAAHKRKGQRGPNAQMRRTGKAERGPEEARPVPTTGPRGRTREPAPRPVPPAARPKRLRPAGRHRQERPRRRRGDVRRTNRQERPEGNKQAGRPGPAPATTERGRRGRPAGGTRRVGAATSCRPGEAWRRPPEQTRSGTGRQTRRAVAGPEYVGGRGYRAIQRAALPCRDDGNAIPGHREAERAKAGETKGTLATAAKRARASEAPAGDEPAAGHRRGLAAPARNMPEKPKRSTGQAKRQEHRPSPRLPKGTSERCGSEGAKGGCRRPAAPRRSRGASLPQESSVPGGLPQGEGDSVRVRPRRGCKASTRTTNPARSAKDTAEQTSAIRPKAKRSGSGRPEKPEKRTTAEPDCERRLSRERTSHSRPDRVPASIAKRVRGTNGGTGEDVAEKAEAKQRTGGAAGATAKLPSTGARRGPWDRRARRPAPGDATRSITAHGAAGRRGKAVPRPKAQAQGESSGAAACSARSAPLPQ